MATDYPEKRSIISGIGISRIGRRTGIPGIELTTEAARAAIADAGLRTEDIDGITTMGDTPLAEAEQALGIQPVYRGGGYDKGGLLSPVMQACFAAGTGRARHILVYRTVQMMGGSILRNEDGKAEQKEQKARKSAKADAGSPPTLAPHDSPMADAPVLLANHAYSAGRLHGYWVLHEACLQLRGEAGQRQVTNPPTVAVAAAGGGPIAGCMLLASDGA